MCTVEEGAYIHNSIVWKETTIEAGAQLTGCILGEGVRIGQHASISEGCIVGDNVKVDAHQVLNPNTLVWPDTTTQ
jgi:NDP-sugar pyrophosphorylase family protein